MESSDKESSNREPVDQDPSDGVAKRSGAKRSGAKAIRSRAIRSRAIEELSRVRGADYSSQASRERAHGNRRETCNLNLVPLDSFSVFDGEKQSTEELS